MTVPAIEFYFDFSSPYGYLAAHRVDALGAEFGREVIWRPILLGAVFKATGQSPLVSQPIRGPYHLHDMKRTARRQKLAFQLPEGFPLATMASARAFYWAEQFSANEAKRLALALFDATFGKGVNTTTTEVVAGIAGQLGFDTAAIRDGIGDPAIKQRLKDETDQAIAKGIFGSPFFLIDGEPFWGNDRIRDMRDWMQTGGW
jgi:2-hydroxychromene-2-carboxylate isomerase